MSKLFLLRHAKAAAALPGMRDFDRRLDARGISDAKAIGLAMKSRGFAPSKILCSSSARTRETLEHAWPEPVETVYSGEVYSGDAGQYLRLIHAHGDTQSLLVIGHNPSTEELAAALAAKHDKPALHLLMEGFPTGGLACFEFPGDLSAIRPGTAMLKDFIRPKDL